jgi:hypothetical protein
MSQAINARRNNGQIDTSPIKNSAIKLKPVLNAAISLVTNPGLSLAG